MTVRTTSEPAIRVQGLEKSYKKLEALRGVDFDVARGSIFALLGPNGAGKTTVVKILSTLLKADTGTASVNGFDVATQPANVRESISLTGQFAAVDEILSGRENLVLVARLRHLKDPGTIADGLLERFALTDAAARKVSTYSGGIRRRLDIAMSLIGNPQVVFLDEPTTGLDPQGRIEVWQAVKELAGHGTTVLLTTQYLDEAEQLADRIAILHEGRIIVNGTLSELKQLLPPAKVEYVEKQPTLEDVFFAIVGDDGKDGEALAMTAASARPSRNNDDEPLLRRHRRPAGTIPAPHHAQPGHHHHDHDHADRIHAAVRLRVRRRDQLRVGFVCELPTAGHSAHHDRFWSLLHRIPAVQRHAERHRRALPVDADRTVGRAVGARGDLAGRQSDLARGRRARRPPDGLPFGGRSAGVARGRRHFDPVHPGVDLDRGDPRSLREVRGRRSRVLLPAHLPTVHQLGIRAHRHHARSGARLRRVSAGDVHRQRDPRPVHTAAGRHGHLDGPCLVCRHPYRRVHLRRGHLPPPALLVDRRARGCWRWACAAGLLSTSFTDRGISPPVPICRLGQVPPLAPP